MPSKKSYGHRGQNVPLIFVDHAIWKVIQAKVVSLDFCDNISKIIFS